MQDGHPVTYAQAQAPDPHRGLSPKEATEDQEDVMKSGLQQR